MSTLVSTRQALAKRRMAGQIATRRMPAPIQADRRWVTERTHARGNQYGKLRWCTERCRLVVELWLALASAVIVCGRLLRRAWIHYRWVDAAAAWEVGHVGRPASPGPPMGALAWHGSR